MANAKRDSNRIQVVLGLSNADGATPLSPYIDSATNRWLVSATTDIGQTEDAVHSSGATGVMILGVRQDSQSDFGADGDYVPFSIDADGAVRVSGGGGGTQYAVDAALGNTPTGTLAIAIRDDALSALTPVEGDAVGVRVGSTGALWTEDVNSSAIKTAVEILDNAISGSEMQVDVVGALPAGTNAIGKLAANSGVDIGDVDVTSIAAGDNNIGNVDIVTVPTDPFGANADAAATAGSTGSMQAKFRLMTSQLDSIKTAVEIVDDWDNGASDGASVSGDVAHDGVDAGEPVKIGGKALNAQPTAVAANDRVNAMFDIYGRQVGIAALREMKGAQKTQISSSTSETTVVTADATYKLDVYGVIITNTSATATEVTFKDSTTGTTRFIIAVPAGDTRGFMLPMDAGHNQNAANNNWTATCADSVAAIEITMMFVKNL